MTVMPPHAMTQAPIEKKRKDYAFRHQFNEKPSIIPGCPGTSTNNPIQKLVPQHACLNAVQLANGKGHGTPQ